MKKWIATAEVSPVSGCSDLELPAIVVVVGMACGVVDFIDVVKAECASIGLQLIDVEDVETWDDRIANWRPEPQVLSMAEKVSEDTPFAFGAFIVFDED
jgi:hypothetical protein